MSDIIALGLYAAVRSCSGPAVPFKSGRIDATEAGPVGVPLPQNSLFTFQNQFARVGFNATEMIQVIACGHTLGGVHASNFPQIVPPGSAPDDVVHFDTTTKFDEKIASEFVSGTTKDPLTVGPSTSNGRNSDYRVFSSDGNVTISAMANPTTYTTTCKALLQRMIEVIPSGITLTDPITPYEIKPTALQLTLLSGGSIIQFAGEIRVRTTTRPASQISSVDIFYKDRTGGSTGCGACKIPTAVKGTAAGFDDAFTFYGFSAPLAADTSISSFVVVVTLATTGAKQIYGNGPAGFPVQDQIMLQAPQSCLSSTALKVVAAVRSSAAGAPPSLDLSLKVARAGIIVPALQAQSVVMTKGSTKVGPYDLYSATYTLDASQTGNTKFDVSLSGGTPKVADSFKNVGDLGGACAPLSGGSTLSSSSSSSTKIVTSTTKSTSSSSSTKTSTSTTKSSSTSTTKSSTSSTTTTKSSSLPFPSPFFSSSYFFWGGNRVLTFSQIVAPTCARGG